MNKQISVVVPCFNEEETIYQNIKRIAEYLQARFDKFEIIAVNDGSADNTAVELLRLKQENISLEVINHEVNEGKGKVVRDGVMASQYDLVMFLDADLGIPIEELEKFVEEIEKGCDIAIASRFVPGLKIKRPVKWHRKVMEKGFRLLRVIIINDWYIKDTQCGFKVFKKDAAMSIFPRLSVKRFAFDAELIFVANKKKFKIKELPITLQNSPRSHVRIIRDPLNMTLDLIKIKVNHLKKRYK
ncbi:MAG: glycosyltransferase [Parcubacteria group bacterium]|jgi:dolichyl-phosphate beta-glucosyltransferase